MAQPQGLPVQQVMPAAAPQRASDVLNYQQAMAAYLGPARLAASVQAARRNRINQGQMVMNPYMGSMMSANMPGTGVQYNPATNNNVATLGNQRNTVEEPWMAGV
jgi:hypothetical protein